MIKVTSADKPSSISVSYTHGQIDSANAYIVLSAKKYRLYEFLLFGEMRNCYYEWITCPNSRTTQIIISQLSCVLEKDSGVVSPSLLLGLEFWDFLSLRLPSLHLIHIWEEKRHIYAFSKGIYAKLRQPPRL